MTPLRYIAWVTEPIREVTEVVGIVDGLLLVTRERVWANGARLAGDFMCDPQLVGWLADQLERAADELVSEASHDSPPDHILLFVRGGDRGAPIGIHVHNRRELTAAHGKTYTLSGMYPEVARKLAADLQAATR
jgi:hypothetical protein